MPKEKQSVEFLLAEHKLIQESFWRNEESGEKRVNFFITLVTAVLAALVALVSNKDGLLQEKDLIPLVAFALLGLLAFGLVTLLRMIRRNQVTDKYKRAMDSIRDYFRNSDVWLEDYQPFEKTERRRLLTGGLVEMVALVNSVIIAALGALFAFDCGWNSWAWGFAGFVIAEALQLVFAKSVYQREAKK